MIDIRNISVPFDAASRSLAAVESVVLPSIVPVRGSRLSRSLDKRF